MEPDRYKLMQLLEARPGLSQREAARELGVSLGKLNYCLRALVSLGLVRAVRCRNARNKAAYEYRLTAAGVRQKARLAAEFLELKIREFEALQLEIEQMRSELEGMAERRP